jgi:hypothetical protein
VHLHKKYHDVSCAMPVGSKPPGPTIKILIGLQPTNSVTLFFCPKTALKLVHIWLLSLYSRPEVICLNNKYFEERNKVYDEIVAVSIFFFLVSVEKKYIMCDSLS